MTGKGARRISFDAGRARSRDRIRGGRRRRDAAPASTPVAADRARPEACAHLRDDRAAGAGSAVPDGAHRRAHRFERARRAKPRARRARESRSSRRRIGSPGTPFNLGSPKQICEILFERMKLPVMKKDADRPAVHRRGSARRSSRPITRCRRCCSSTGRSRSSSRRTRTSCRRWSTRVRDACIRRSRRRRRSPGGSRRTSRICRTFPVRTADGRRIREAFIAPPGHALISADYSQVELRIMAHLSEDPALLQSLSRGR